MVFTEDSSEDRLRAAPDTAALPAGDELLARARRTDAWTTTRKPILTQDSVPLSYPQYFQRAQGAYLWDADGHRYIDYTLGYGPIILGHGDERVNSAVQREMANGTCITPMSSLRQIELAELLVATVPGAEQAYLMKTGSDATSAAVRLARIATGRWKVAKWGFNGWHDWTVHREAGVPADVRDQTLHFEYNNVASVQALFDRHPDEIACIIMMPFENEIPVEAFLHDVRDIAHRNGALFVLDEVRSGFRIALGGAQEHFGIEADLATFSKAMANGHAISAVVGRRDLLGGLARTKMSSTCYTNPPEMAAAIATISALRDTCVIRELWRRGSLLQHGLAAIVAGAGLDAKVIGYPFSPMLRFGSGRSAQAARFRFFTETVRGGLLLHPKHQWFVCAAHTDADIDETLSVCAGAAEKAVSVQHR